MRRQDVSRSGVSEEELAEELHVQWIRRNPRLEPAWTDQPRMQFDAAYDPVVLGKTVYVGSSHNDTLTALDTDTGGEKWRYRAGGPGATVRNPISRRLASVTLGVSTVSTGYGRW